MKLAYVPHLQLVSVLDTQEHLTTLDEHPSR